MLWKESHGWERYGQWIVGRGGGIEDAGGDGDEGLGSAWEVRLVLVSYTGLGCR